MRTTLPCMVTPRHAYGSTRRVQRKPVRSTLLGGGLAGTATAGISRTHPPRTTRPHGRGASDVHAYGNRMAGAALHSVRPHATSLRTQRSLATRGGGVARVHACSSDGARLRAAPEADQHVGRVADVDLDHDVFVSGCIPALSSSLSLSHHAQYRSLDHVFDVCTEAALLRSHAPLLRLLAVGPASCTLAMTEAQLGLEKLQAIMLQMHHRDLLGRHPCERRERVASGRSGGHKGLGRRLTPRLLMRRRPFERPPRNAAAAARGMCYEGSAAHLRPSGVMGFGARGKHTPSTPGPTRSPWTGSPTLIRS